MDIKEKENIIAADCPPEEVDSFKDGLSDSLNEPFVVFSSISNWKREGAFTNLRRYSKYFSFPFKLFLHRKKFNYILGWQQFYAINFAFFCRLFHVKKSCKLIVVNFSYKQKKGIIGRLYFHYMNYSLNSYVDYLHVPSYSYAKRCSKIFDIDISRFIVTGFGVQDSFDSEPTASPHNRDYCLSIGRSNRDFDFLVNVWSQPSLKNEFLVIASDSWSPSGKLPDNVEHKKDIDFLHSFEWIRHCKMNITSLENTELASGDTTLLTGMMFARPTAISAPSTLAEMYIKDKENGIHFPKIISEAAEIISSCLKDETVLSSLGHSARNEYLQHYTRYDMGRNLSRELKKSLLF